MGSHGVKSLLAVDDNPDAAHLIVRISNKCGYLGRALSDTRDIRHVLKEWQPDVLTLDLCMPEEDGFQILPILQEVEFKGHLVVISGKDEWLRKSGMRAGRVTGDQNRNALAQADKRSNIPGRAYDVPNCRLTHIAH
jgi:DNA-binding response OmpR family regulator